MPIEGYYREKLTAAVSCLVGAGDIRARLLMAFVSMPTVVAEKFPTVELQDAFRALHEKATRVTYGRADDGLLKSAIDLMSDEEAADLANDILAVHNEMLRRAVDPFD